MKTEVERQKDAKNGYYREEGNRINILFLIVYVHVTAVYFQVDFLCKGC